MLIVIIIRRCYFPAVGPWGAQSVSQTISKSYQRLQETWRYQHSLYCYSVSVLNVVSQSVNSLSHTYILLTLYSPSYTILSPEEKLNKQIHEVVEVQAGCEWEVAVWMKGGGLWKVHGDCMEGAWRYNGIPSMHVKRRTREVYSRGRCMEGKNKFETQRIPWEKKVLPVVSSATWLANGRLVGSANRIG